MAQGGGSVVGIMVGITPGAGTWYVELQRSSGAVTSTDWVTIANIRTRGVSTSWEDELPNDNGIRNYRARHTGSGYTAGAWSTRVSVRPIDVYQYPV